MPRSMQKEKIITIVIGLLIGVSAAGFFFFSSRLKQKPRTAAVQIVSDSGSPSAKTTSFTLVSPQDGIITLDSQIKVSGTGQSEANVIVVSNSSEIKSKITDDGKFESNIKLEEGENRIQVIYLVDGQQPLISTRTVTLDI